MKRFAILFALILLAWIVALAGCARIDDNKLDTEPYPTDPFPPATDTEDCSKADPVPDVVEVVNIIDQTKDGDICTADALEGFYSDNVYDYYFPSIKSGYIIVHYSDGTTQPIREAMGDGRVTISDLDRFNIGYYKEEKNPPVYVVQIIDRTVTEKIPTDTALEKFWEDEYAEYFFPSIRSEYVIVIYSNDEVHYIKEAMESGMVSIDQLDLYNIDYITMDKSVELMDLTVVKITNRAKEYGFDLADMEEVFYEDDLFRYIFPSLMSEYVIVEYDDGWRENIKTALKYGRASIEDLDKFGIQYYKEPKAELSNPNIKDIYDREARGEIKNDSGNGMYDDVFDVFYIDDNYKYVLMSTPLETAVVVVYHDGTMESVGDALAAERITISDLDAFGIGYERYPK